MIIKWTVWRLSQAQTSSDIPHTSKKIFQAESCQIQRNFGDFILSCSYFQFSSIYFWFELNLWSQFVSCWGWFSTWISNFKAILGLKIFSRKILWVNQTFKLWRNSLKFFCTYSNLCTSKSNSKIQIVNDFKKGLVNLVDFSISIYFGLS